MTTFKAITGKQVRRLMLLNLVTIRGLAGRTGFTLKRIREVRTDGLADWNAARDWVQAITGQDPGDLQTRPDWKERLIGS